MKNSMRRLREASRHAFRRSFFFAVRHFDHLELYPLILSLRWEGGNYHLGQFHDNSFKELSSADQATRQALTEFNPYFSNLFSRGIRMHVYTVRFFIKSLKAGSKHVFETVPRLLTIWLDVGADEKLSRSESFKKIHDNEIK